MLKSYWFLYYFVEIAIFGKKIVSRPVLDRSWADLLSCLVLSPLLLCVLEHLGGLLGALLVPLGASWGCLGASWGRLGTLFGAAWVLLGMSWHLLGASWAPLKAVHLQRRAVVNLCRDLSAEKGPLFGQLKW